MNEEVLNGEKLSQNKKADEWISFSSSFITFHER